MEISFVLSGLTPITVFTEGLGTLIAVSQEVGAGLKYTIPSRPLGWYGVDAPGM